MRPPMKRARENEQGIHSSAENELNTAETKVESEAAKLSTPGSVDINPIASSGEKCSKSKRTDEPPSKTAKKAADGDGDGEASLVSGKGKGPATSADNPGSLEAKDARAAGATAAGGGSEAVGGSFSGSTSAGVGTGREQAGPEVEGIPNETLFVGNLSYKVSEAVIIKLFTPYGKVVREQFCYHMTGPRRGEPRGFCFVEYSEVQDAAKAIRALHGRKLYGRPLRVRYMTVEGEGRTDYTSDRSGKRAVVRGYGELDKNGVGKIPSADSAPSDTGAGAGVTKLSLDKKVALLKLKLREAGKSKT